LCEPKERKHEVALRKGLVVLRFIRDQDLGNGHSVGELNYITLHKV